MRSGGSHHAREHVNGVRLTSAQLKFSSPNYRYPQAFELPEISCELLPAASSPSQPMPALIAVSVRRTSAEVCVAYSFRPVPCSLYVLRRSARCARKVKMWRVVVSGWWVGGCLAVSVVE